MANNYTPSYNQYRTQTAGYVLPSSVRTYSVFDPASNTWRRMTNDGMSPMPQGNQPDIQAALAQARQTQGTVYPAQGMDQGQPVEMHPGYLNPPTQASVQTPSQVPAQTPAGGPKTPSQPLPRGEAVPVQGQPSGASQRAVETPTAVQTGNPYMGYAEGRREFEDPDAFLHETPIGVPGYQGKRSYTATPVDIENVKQMFQESGPKFNQWGETYSPQQLRTRALLEHDLPKPSGTEVMAELFADAATAGTAGAIGGAIERGLIKNAAKRAFLNNPEAYYSASNANRGFMRDVFRAQQRMNMTEQEAALAKANKFSPAASEWVSPTTPSVGAGLSRGTANYTIPRAPRALDPMRKVTTYVPTPETPVQIIRPLANMPVSSARLALPPGTGAIPMGRTPTVIRTPLEMTTPSGLARWQYRLDQLSGLGR